MSTFRGSISNYPLNRKLFIILLSMVLPAVLISLTVVFFFLFSWWGMMLVLDLLALIIAFSFSGMILRGSKISLFEDELSFIRGWSGGRVPYRNIIRIYRVFNEHKNAILIIFNEPASKSNPNRCLTVEQVYSERDRNRLFRELKRLHGKFTFSIIDSADLELIENDKDILKWVPV